MAVTEFIPEIWSGVMLAELDTNLTYATPGVANREYEGEVRQAGDTVHITTPVDVSIQPYSRYTPMTDAQAAVTEQLLVIDRARAWNFTLDDLDRAQAANDGSLVNENIRRAAQLVALDHDAYVAGLMAAGVAAGNLIAEQTLTKGTDDAKAYELLLDLAQKLTEGDVPVDGRWAVVTPAFLTLLLRDQRFVSTGGAESEAIRASGVVGRAAGFTILVSNVAPDGPGIGAGKLILAGHPSATTFASQVAKVESIRMEGYFADKVRGLSLAGAKVTRPTALAAADVIVA